MDIQPAADKKTRLFVAVHGIGDQFRYATVQAAARQITGFCGRPIGLPLGAFHLLEDMKEAYGFSDLPSSVGKLGDVGFGEIFWADIHRKAAVAGDTIEEEKSWARTVVERLRAMDESPDVHINGRPAEKKSIIDGCVGYLRAIGRGRRGIDFRSLSGKNRLDYVKTAAVMDEIIQTLATIENLVAVADKAGWFKFDLKTILTDFIGTVQVVAEFRDYRNEIMDRFRGSMNGFLANHPDTDEIHIIAHSEGTVVALRVLMEIFSGGGAPEDMNWASRIRGLMTIGSPLNKHFVMWPDLWKSTTNRGAIPLTPRPEYISPYLDSIVWQNYYDYGDPVGFDLAISRTWLKDQHWLWEEGKGGIFKFDDDKDHGFTRYPLPGKAHNDYWDDPDVFAHYIETTVLKIRKDKPGPETKPFAYIISLTFPYCLCFVILAVGVYLLYKPVIAVIDPKECVSIIAGSVMGLTCLLSGITVLSRIPRLIRFGFWHLVALLIFGLGAWAYYAWADGITQCTVASAFGFLHMHSGAAVGVGLAISLLSGAIWKVWPGTGMYPLIVLGTIAALKVVVQGLRPYLWESPQLWPLLLAAIAFALLWTLAALLFDLSFIWHRYIRGNGAMDVLNDLWSDYQKSRSGDPHGKA